MKGVERQGEVPPSRAVAVIVGQIKGAAAHQLNQWCPGAIHWQDGYGIVSFRARELETVKRYIATQQQRHQAAALSPLLETWEQSNPDG